MKINADFKQRAAVHGSQIEWIDSPMQGVSRKPLDRIGGEVARATSIVKYEPGSNFSPHVHTGGEEFVVLEGVFQDEHGDFPAGSYIRNPPQSRHKPGSEAGCIILVKLWQFDLDDRTHVRLNSRFMRPTRSVEQDGTPILPLYYDQDEEVMMQFWDAHQVIQLDASGGMEVFVLDGSFKESEEKFETHSWLRLPLGSNLQALAGEQGARVWIKRNHLHRAESEIDRIEQANAGDA